MLKNSSIYLLSVFISTFLGFITLPFFTQYLSISDYGLLALFILFGSVLANSLSFGLQSATFRFYFKLDKARFGILNMTIILFISSIFILVGTLLIFPYAAFISSFIFDNELSAKLIKLSFISGCLHYFYVYFNHLLTIQKRAISSSFISISHVIINLSLTFYFIKYQSMTYMAAIYSFLIANGIVALLALIFNYRQFKPNISITHLKKSLIFAYAEVPTLIVGLLYGSFDKAMLASNQGASSVGYYEFGSRFAIILKAFMDAISRSWIPFFMENAEKKTNEANIDIVRRFYELSVLFAFVGLCVAYFTEEALIILTTIEFYDAKYITPFLVLYYLIGTLGFLSVNQLMFAEKLFYNFPASIIGLTINILLNIQLIPLYGAMGAVIATAIATSFVSITLLYFSNKVHPLPFSYKKLSQLFILVIIYVLLIYPVYFFEFWLFWKLLIKSLLLCSFVFLSIKLDFISAMIIKRNIKKIITLRF